MSRHVEVKMTEREASELWSLLFAVLTNADQWESYDLAALNRVAQKIKNGSEPVEQTQAEKDAVQRRSEARAREHYVTIRTRYGETTRECYCAETDGQEHHEGEHPWIDLDGKRGPR